jgi:hypothetical protein
MELILVLQRRNTMMDEKVIHDVRGAKIKYIKRKEQQLTKVAGEQAFLSHVCMGKWQP